MSAANFLLHHRTKLLVLSNSNVLKYHCKATLKTATNASSKWWLWWWSTASWSKQQQRIAYHNYNYYHSKNHHCSFLLHNNHLDRQSSKFNDRNRNFCSDSSSDSSGKGKLVAFNLSDIGEGIGEVTIKEWFVKVGDQVKQFDNICEVQSDKASVTITSRFDGIIKKIYYKVDELAKVGEPLVDILINDEDDDGEEGSTEDQTESLAGEETPKANNHESDETMKMMENDYLGSGKILTTPAVRRMALEHKIHLDQVKGTGKDGRIMKEDMLNYINNSNKTITQGSQPSVSPQQQSTKSVTITSEPRKPPTPSSIPQARPMPLKEDRVESMTSVMKGMYKTMTKSLNVPHFGLSEEIDLTCLVEMKAEMKQISMEKGVPLSFMPFFIKAASLSLNEYPILNSTIQEDGEKIIYKSSHNIGVAMDTKQGLLVPNIKHVNQMTLLDIAQELQRLQNLAQKGQLGVKDLTGGTFTLSNIGSIGGLFGIPVLMPGEVVIGAIGKTRQVPRFADDSTDQIRRAHIVQVLWSADHRIIDGATMTRFCQTWKQYLENPLRIFIC